MDRCIIEQKCTFWYWICNAWDENKKKFTQRDDTVSVARHCIAEQMPSAEKSNTVQLIEYFTKCHITVARCSQTGWKFTWEWTIVNEQERSIKFDIWDKNSRTRLGISIDCYCCCRYCKFNWSNHHTCIQKTNEKKRDTKKKTQMRWETVFKIRIEFCAFVYLAEFFYLFSTCAIILLTFAWWWCCCCCHCHCRCCVINVATGNTVGKLIGMHFKFNN